MKKTILLVITLFAFALSFAQPGYKKRPTLAVQFSLNDFKAASEIRQSDLAHVLNSKQFFKFKQTWIRVLAAQLFTRALPIILMFRG
jgi:hypothetical protein